MCEFFGYILVARHVSAEPVTKLSQGGIYRMRPADEKKGTLREKRFIGFLGKPLVGFLVFALLLISSESLE